MKLTNATTKKHNIYSAEIQYLKNEFTLPTELNKPNTKYNKIINKCNYLGGIQMHDTDTKNLLFRLYWQRVISQKLKGEHVPR